MIWETTDDVLDYAIAAEELAIRGYTQMASEAKSEKTRALLLRFSAEEVGHRKKLKSLKDSGSFSQAALDLAAMEKDLQPKAQAVESMSPRDAFAFALRSEKEAEFLYSTLADMAEDEEQASMFRMLADEEGIHIRELNVSVDL
jgi:rubrerythrin